VRFDFNLIVVRYRRTQGLTAADAGGLSGEIMGIRIQTIRRFLKAEDGPTSVEYCFMLGFIILVCIVAIGLLGDATQGSFKESADKIIK